MGQPPILQLGEIIQLEKGGESWEVIRVSSTSADLKAVKADEITLTDKHEKTRVVRYHRLMRGVSAHSSVFREPMHAE